MFEAMEVSPMKGSEHPAKLEGKVVVITGNVNKFSSWLSMVTK